MTCKDVCVYVCVGVCESEAPLKYNRALDGKNSNLLSWSE